MDVTQSDHAHSAEMDIQFSGSLTREQYLQADSLASAATLPFAKILMVLGGFELVFGGWLLLSHSGLVLESSVQLVAAYIFILMGWQMRKRSVYWDHTPDCRQRLWGTFSEKGVDIHGETSWSFISWSEFTHWIASDDLLVINSPAGARVFPLAHFESAAAWEAACALCACRLPRLSKQGVRAG